MRVLHVFATHRELGRLAPEFADVCVTGVGKATAAAQVAWRLAHERFDRVVVAGVAGAYRSSHGAGEMTIGEVCVVRSAVFGDEGVETPSAFLDLDQLGLAGELVRATHDPDLTAIACRALAGAPAVSAATVSTCSGNDRLASLRCRRTHASIETMESAAIALAAHIAGVPLLEIRTISNWCGDRRSAAWDLPRATDRLAECMLTLREERGLV